MWQRIKEYFAITKSESRGLAVLFVLITCLWGINFYLRYFAKPPITGIDYEILQSVPGDTSRPRSTPKKTYTVIGFFNPNEIDYEDLIRSGLSERLSRSVVNYRKKGGKFFNLEEVYKIYYMDSAWVKFHAPYMIFGSKSDGYASRQTIKLKPFDPNQADSMELYELGFKPWQISNLLRYRSRGGKFFKKEDLRRLYGIDSIFYRTLEPYIQIASDGTNKENDENTTVALTDINSADSATLVSIRGIGPTLAHRIIRYRNSLGGFVREEQLLEVYGIDSSRFEWIKPQISLDTSLIRKININTASEEQLIVHPYISPGLAREIVAFRKNFRLFQSVFEIEKLNLAKNKDLSKLYPYLTTGEN
ncbi:helix-hairpin-helix domain-containing protein [Schleiferia thermophila]|uniref:helix-hairpin-helix domain-containing protein n=1 Tax=Schleiferia thermophila TaxID=884107 RepID=UPI003EE8745B